MLTTLNSTTINSIVLNLEKAIEEFKSEIENIEETYKKMMEEAKSTLQDQLDESVAQHDYWLKQLGNAPVEEKKTRKPRAKKTETVVEESTDAVVTENVPEEKVVDTIFPENNEDPDTEEVTEEPVVEETNQEESSDVVVEDIDWGDDEEEEDKDDDEWPDVPQEF